MAGHLVSTIQVAPGSVDAVSLAAVLGDPPGGVGMSILSHDRAADSTPADAAGDAQLRFGPVPQGHLWLLESVLVQVANAPGSVASVYVGSSVSAINLVAGTTRGDLDVADRSPAVPCPGGSFVIVEWAGAGDGDVCTVSIQYRVAVLS